jgi:hypothetical protein
MGTRCGWWYGGAGRIRTGIIAVLGLFPMILAPIAAQAESAPASGSPPAATPGRPLSQKPTVTHGKTLLPQRTVQPGQGPGPLPADHPQPIVIGPAGGGAPATTAPAVPRKPADPSAGRNIGAAAIPFAAPVVPESERRNYLRRQPEAPRP